MNVGIREAQQIAQREIKRKKSQYVGYTVSQPEFTEHEGKYEWIVNVKVLDRTTWKTIYEVPIVTTQAGYVTDLNMPVLLEKSETGQFTVVGRSQIRIANISSVEYSLYQLDFTFMANLTLVKGIYYDGFGYAMTAPEDETVVDPIRQSYGVEPTPFDEQSATDNKNTVKETTTNL